MAAFDRIQASDSAADMNIFTSLLSLCVTRSDRDAASRVYDAMMGSANRGKMKDMENAVTSMIRVSCVVGDLAAAERYLDSLIDGGGRPRLRTFSPLIQAHARCGSLWDTFRFFHAARARGLQPTEPEFRALFLAASANGRPGLAEAVLDDAKTVLYTMGPEFAREVAAWYRRCVAAAGAPVSLLGAADFRSSLTWGDGLQRSRRRGRRGMLDGSGHGRDCPVRSRAAAARAFAR